MGMTKGDLKRWLEKDTSPDNTDILMADGLDVVALVAKDGVIWVSDIAEDYDDVDEADHDIHEEG